MHASTHARMHACMHGLMHARAHAHTLRPVSLLIFKGLHATPRAIDQLRYTLDGDRACKPLKISNDAAGSIRAVVQQCVHSCKHLCVSAFVRADVCALVLVPFPLHVRACLREWVRTACMRARCMHVSFTCVIAHFRTLKSL